MGLFGSGGFSIGGMNFGGSDAKSGRTIRSRGRQVLKGILEPSDREAFGRAQREFEAAPGIIQGGYKMARREAGNAFRGAQRSILDQGQRAEGNALSQLTNSGFSGAGSIASNLRLGVGYGTARAIQDVQDRVAQIGAGLATGEAQDVANARSNLGQFYMNRGLADRQRNMLHWWLLTGQNGLAASQPPNDLSGIVKLGATLFGGGGGAAGGAQAGAAQYPSGGTL